MSGRRPRHIGDLADDVTTASGDDCGRRLFRVRPEARRIWQQHTGGSVGTLLGQPQPHRAVKELVGLPTVQAGGSECVNAREKLRTNRSQGRHSGGGRQPMRALPINGVTEEALSHSKSSSSSASFATSPRSPRRHIDLSQLSGDLAAVEGVRGVRVISPGRHHANTENGGIPSPREAMSSVNGGFPSQDEGISSNGRFRRVPSSAEMRSGSLSSGVTRSSSATDMGRLTNSDNPEQPPRSHNENRKRSSNVNGHRFPSSRTNGEGVPSPRANGEGIPSPAAGSWSGSGDVSDRTRSVHLAVPSGDLSDRSSDCDLRRERIRALIGSLRGSPTDGTARAVASDARELQMAGRLGPVSSTAGIAEPPVTRFSDETRLSFREQAIERARAPYRAPSLVGSRKFKSTETLRDGVGARSAPTEPSTRLLNRRKSQSVTKLSRVSDNPAAVRTGDKSDTAAKSGAVTSNMAATCATNGSTNDHQSRVSRGRLPDQATSSPNATSPTNPSPKHSSHDSSEPVKDFVRLNRHLASQRSRRAKSLSRSEDTRQPAAGRTLPGSLPRYLVRRQQQWRDEERRRLEAAPDPACPPGHSRMPDQERLQTLGVLRENHETLLSELRALPIAHSSSRLVAHRADLEQQLQKVEEGIRIFSRAKVFIKNDA